MGCPKPDCDLVIPAHAHAFDFQTMAIGNLAQQGKMRGRLFIHRRDAHQALDRQVKVITAHLDEIIRILWRNSGLLFFFAGIDLNEQIRAQASGDQQFRSHQKARPHP